VTVSTSYAFDPSCDTIMRSALQLAGLLPLGRTPSGAEMAHARFFLDLFLKGARGAALTQLERTSIQLAPGTKEYTLPADTIEVNEPMMLQLAGQTTQTIVAHSVFHEYQALSDKDASGTPVLCYIEKQALVTLVLWPVPAQVYTLSFQRQRLVRDAGSGSTVDLKQRWLQGIAYQMAAAMALAGSIDLNRVKYLQQMGDRYLQDAETFENESSDAEFTLPRLR